MCRKGLSCCDRAKDKGEMAFDWCGRYIVNFFRFLGFGMQLPFV
jgi:hypothetical protein